jgi:hypothetical protein
MEQPATQNATDRGPGQAAGGANDWSDVFGYLRKVAERITAGMIMTRFEDLVCAGSSLTVGQALELMGGCYDQLPVIQGGEYRGLAHADVQTTIDVFRDLQEILAAADCLLQMKRPPAGPA